MNKIINQIKKLSFLQLMPLLVVVAVSIGYFGSHTYAESNSTKSTVCMDTCVAILKDGFSQSEIAVKTGNYVEFDSRDGQIHNLGLGSGVESHEEVDTSVQHEDHESAEHTEGHDHIEGTESGEFGDGEAWRVQFKTPGTYMIHDDYYPEHTILVVVYDRK